MVAADLRSAFASASAAAVVAWRAAREGRRAGARRPARGAAGGPAGAAELPLLDRDGEGRQGAPPRRWGSVGGAALERRAGAAWRSGGGARGAAAGRAAAYEMWAGILGQAAGRFRVGPFAEGPDPGPSAKIFHFF